MLETLKTENFEYKKLSPEEMKARGILGRLEGPCADIVNGTRNRRKYSEALWDKVFNSTLVKEQFKAGGIFGELCHPNYEEVALEKVAIIMPEPPKKNKEGLLIGHWDILDTPMGRILKTICDYGYKVGISTRGSGDTFTNYEGEEEVDPDSYTLNALDIVTVPAVEKARLNYMTESLHKDNKMSLKESLQKVISEAENDNDRKLMREALDDLDIKLEDKPDILSLVSNQFGVTTEPYTGPTYILPNGAFLNIQNSKHHSEVEKWLIDSGYSNNEYNISTGSKTLFDLGCIRCDTLKYYVALPENQLTREQYNSLLVWLDYLSSSTKMVEIITADNQSIVYNFIEIIPDYIINRIRRYYSSGVLYEKLNQKHQHNFIYKRESIGSPLGNPLNEDTKINVPVSASPEGAKIEDEEEIEDAEENNASSKEADNIDVDNDDIAADNDGADDLKNLQEALRQNRQLERKIIDLQEKLSVCYAKEAKYEASLSKYRTSIRALSESLKSKSVLDEKVSVLENQLDEKTKTIKEKESIIEKLEKDKQVLSYRKREEVYTLNEGLNKKDEQITSLTRKVSSLKESLSNAKEESQKEIDKLNEELSEAKKDSLIASKNYSNKLSKQNELVEQYKQIANRAVNKYIDSQALRLGLTSEEIKNRLPKGYSFNDIDTICENLQTYRVGVSKLPFNVETLNEDFSGMKIKATESKEPILGVNAEDDTVDNSLMSMVNTILNK